MSLINKMLRDLDARHAATAQTAIPGEVRPLPEKIVHTPRIGRGVWLLVGLVALAVAGMQTSNDWLPPLRRLGIAAGWLRAEQRPAVHKPAPAPKPAPQPASPKTITRPAVKAPAPETMLPLPSVTETLAPAREPPPSAPKPAPVAAAPTSSPAPTAHVANSGLKIDRSLPQLAAPPAASQPRMPVAAVKPKAAKPGAKPPKTRVVIDRVHRLATAQGRAEARYRKGVAAYKRGHVAEAMAQFRAALQEDPRQIAARQTLLSLLAEQKRWDAVQTLLTEGLALIPAHVPWAMALARIQVQQGNIGGAWDTLQKYMPYGRNNADYQGFAGVLLQRLGKPRDAVARYQAALRLKPNEARWWLGLGLALESEGRAAEAHEAFRRAQDGEGLTPAMLALLRQKLH